MTDPGADGHVEPINLSYLKPYFSIFVVECIIEDADRAFAALQRFMRREASDRGQSITAQLIGETEVDARKDDNISGLGPLSNFGFDRLYAVTRRRTQTPPWATKVSDLVDVVHELGLAVRRNRLVAIRSGISSAAALLKWVNLPTTPYRQIPPDVMSGTFDGAGTMLWLQGVHRQRSSKANHKSYGGIRLQEVLDTLEDASFALSAMTVDILPAEADALLRGKVTVSPDKSSLSFKSMSGLPMFLMATDEALDLLEKSIASETPPEPIYPQLAVREKDLTNVLGAYDVRIATPDEIAGLPHVDDATFDRAELLRESLLDVEGDSRSAIARITVGADGAICGRLQLKPVAVKGGFELDVRYAGTPTDPSTTRQIRDALQDGDLLTIYYESGHTFTEGRIARRNLNSPPFTKIRFEDFTGFNVTREKPRPSGDQAIHRAIARNGDDSLFAWVAHNYNQGSLICDDGSGEVADFLHISEKGELTAIHVKAAHSSSQARGIAVTRFEQLVSQAEKSIKRLDNETLLRDLGSPRIAEPACWEDGQRVRSRTAFLERLQMRIFTDKTFVLLVQPHLLEAVYQAARDRAQAGEPTRDSNSLALLDNLMHSTRRTVTAFWDDLDVIGCRD